MTKQELQEQFFRRFGHRFGEILQIAEEGIVSINRDQKIVFFNHGAETIFGYSAAEVLGESLEILLPACCAPGHADHVRSFISSRVPARLMAQRNAVKGRRKNGDEFPVEISISQFHDGDEVVCTAILRDVSERKAAEELIRRMNQELEARVRQRTAELEESNRQLARKSEENEMFVYSVSHDLRSPLVNLEGFSKELEFTCQDIQQLLLASQIPEEPLKRITNLIDGEVKLSLHYIRVAVDRLSRIIDALLRLSRVGRIEYHPEFIAIGPIVERIVMTLRGTIEEKGAEVIVEPLGSVWGDPFVIEQIFANLIGNAVQYLDPKRLGRVVIGMTPTSSAAYNTYFVRDNGIGIQAAHHMQIFQVFRRLQPTMGTGEGIGLALTRRIVERMGGRIWFESEEGKGTTFYVSLPAQHAE